MRFTAFLLGLSMLPSLGAAAPAADLWEHWAQHDERNPARIDHSPWQRFLNQFVHSAKNDIHRVDYAAVSQSEKHALNAYLDQLQNTRVTQLRRSEQLAFWINLYNAQVVSVILNEYPISSVQDADLSGLFGNGPWDAVLLEIESRPITLNDIHHRILRPIWQTPMIHYALSCGAVGCPNLSQEAFNANNSRGLMSEAAFEFVNHPRGAYFTRDGQLSISSLYYWYSKDFGGESQLVEHLRQYALPSLARQLKTLERASEEHFDWRLNDAVHKP